MNISNYFTMCLCGCVFAQRNKSKYRQVTIDQNISIEHVYLCGYAVDDSIDSSLHLKLLLVHKIYSQQNTLAKFFNKLAWNKLKSVWFDFIIIQDFNDLLRGFFFHSKFPNNTNVFLSECILCLNFGFNICLSSIFIYLSNTKSSESIGMNWTWLY